ncbi:hypothetical protein EWB00_009483 [Schistosoma japonicum]|uniref:Uncharacterized protein n=1 Tax=Schistosoma japonicum TaxID=6182 RepID=A0A4Z2DRM1_SCHJA|nr:hypothetical protein KSF78_0003010 [Schistosoma japonicum]TNN19072.1 hypothetical protein EWB00_009483 [Schistosoma japonicum]
MNIDNPEIDTKELRKLIEDKANNTIEEVQRFRDKYRKEMTELKHFVMEQVSVFFADLEARSQKQENSNDEIIQRFIVDLMEQLESIDSLLNEISTCKTTLSKLNEMLIGKEDSN